MCGSLNIIALVVALVGSACLGSQPAQQRTLRATTTDLESSTPEVRRVERGTAEVEATSEEANEAAPPRVIARDEAAAGGAEEPSAERAVRRVDVSAAGGGRPNEVDEPPDPLTLPSDERFICPVAEPDVSSPFGTRRDPIRRSRRRMHRGVDYRGARGTAVHATASGRAIMAGWCDRGTGNCVVLDHPHGWRSQYFHLSDVHIRNGDWVEQGQHIGDIGSTGRSTGPHLHFQLGRDGQAVDPETLIGAPLGE